MTHDIPTASGSLCFTESMPYFADNDLGTGSVTTIKCQVEGRDAWEMAVTLTWVDWNLVEFTKKELENESG
jgi:hypothetical protein